MREFLSKTLKSRKFWGFMLATVLMFFGKLDPWAWLGAYAIYSVSNVGQKVLDKTVSRISGGGENGN